MSVVILCETTDTFSAAHTSSALRPVIESWFGRMTNDAWGTLHHHIRKTGHFIGYGLVSVAYMRGWLHAPERPVRVSSLRWTLRAGGLGVLSAAAIASLDEWHQTFLPSRTGTPFDVGLDTLGAIAMTLIVVLVMARMLRGEDRFARE